MRTFNQKKNEKTGAVCKQFVLNKTDGQHIDPILNHQTTL